jgi:acyl-phosphate glycerol 3-phosphate acyltransferase
MPGAVTALLASVIGLLLGSVLPADLLARNRGVDIRGVGDGNPGTVNAFRALGVGPGLVTGVYDAGVGVAAIAIARLLGASEGAAYVAGIMAVVGHRLPVYRGFRGGGQGMAACAGLLIYGVGVAMSRGWLPLLGLLSLIAILLVTFVLSRSDRLMAIVTLPILLIMLAAGRADPGFLAFMAIAAANIWFVQVSEVRTAGWSLRTSRERPPE